MVVGDVTTAVNTLIVGGGPGGYVAAIRAAQLGQVVTLVSDGPPGGTCLNSGCIPLKALVSAARRYRQTSDETSRAMGIEVGPPSLDWAKLQSWKGSVVERLSGGVARLLAGHRIETVSGLGWFLNGQELRVEGEYGSHRFAFDKCLLATGAVAVALPDLPFGADVLTPQQALALTTLPASLSVIGQDYIALELATLFQSLGTAVTLLSPAEGFLPEVEPAAGRLVLAGLRKLGVEVVSGAGEWARTENGQLQYSVGQSRKQAVGPVVVSGGVRPATERLHLATMGLTTGLNGAIEVNQRQQTSLPQILAVGDCLGGIALATTAIKQAKIAAHTLAGQRVAYAPQALPQVVHTTPELAWVGLTAGAARDAGYEVVTGRFPLAANGRALTLGAESGVALSVAEAGSGLLLGLTLVGPGAGDLIMEAALAIEMSATVSDLTEILHPHPGLAELTLESLENSLGLAVHLLP